MQIPTIRVFVRPLSGRSEDVFFGGDLQRSSHVEGFPLNQAALVQGLGRTMMQLIPQHFLLANGFFPFRGPTKFHPVEG